MDVFSCVLKCWPEGKYNILLALAFEIHPFFSFHRVGLKQKVSKSDINRYYFWMRHEYLYHQHCHRFGFNKVYECTLRAKSGNSSSLYNTAMAEKIASVQIKALFEEDNILVEFQSALRAHRSTENCCSFNKLSSLGRKQVLCFAHSTSNTINKEIFAFSKWQRK